MLVKSRRIENLVFFQDFLKSDPLLNIGFFEYFSYNDLRIIHFDPKSTFVQLLVDKGIITLRGRHEKFLSGAFVS